VRHESEKAGILGNLRLCVCVGLGLGSRAESDGARNESA
jgi:hypothetical protein